MGVGSGWGFVFWEGLVVIVNEVDSGEVVRLMGLGRWVIEV